MKGSLLRFGIISATLLSVFILGPLGAATSSNEATATFDYLGPSTILGEFRGTCGAHGIVFPVGETTGFTIGGGRIVIHRTYVNKTHIDPDGTNWANEQPDNIQETVAAIPRGRLEVVPVPNGLAVGLALPSTNFAPLPVEVTARNVTLSGPAYARRTPADHYFEPWGGPVPGMVATHISRFPDVTREVAGDGESHLRGDFRVYLRQATIAAGDQVWELPPYGQEQFSVSSPAAMRRSMLYTDAFLELEDAQVTFAATGLMCGSLRGRVVGTFVADQATGTAQLGDQQVSFEGKVLDLAGSFLLDETPQFSPTDPWAEAPTVSATARGSITALGIDFAPAAAVPKGFDAAKAVGIFAILVAAALLAAKYAGSFVGLFYSRFGREDVLNNQSRDLLYQAVRQNPGANLSELTRLTSLHMTSVLYHVQVLSRTGLVSTIRQGRNRRIIPKDRSHREAVADLFAQVDPPVGFLQRLTGSGPVLLATAVRNLQEAFGLSQRGAYAAVQRGLRHGVVKRLGSPPEVMIG